jgi:hypothetical protein
MAGPWNIKTKRGFPLDEVISSIQKTIRRGQADEALFWTYEAVTSGYGAYVWRRLFIVSCEDVGLADPTAAVVVNALYQQSQMLVAAQKAEPRQVDADGKPVAPTTIWPTLQILQAAWHLARCPKSREMAYAECTLLIRMHRGQLLEVQDWAKDQHTSAGRAKGRGLVHFLQAGPDGGRHIENHVPVDGDVWQDRFFGVHVPGKPSDRRLEGE